MRIWKRKSGCPTKSVSPFQRGAFSFEQLLLASCLILTLAGVFGEPYLKPLFKLLRFKKGRARGQGDLILGPIHLTEEDRVRHAHIVGATGSGKTVLMEALVYEDIRQGRGALIIDPKGDRDLFDRIKAYAEKIGRANDLHLLSAVYPAESSRWNPCRLGTASEIQSKLLNSCEFSEAFYKKACESHLLSAVNHALKGEHFHLTDLVAELKRGDGENIQGLYFDFNNLIESEWKEVLCAVPPCDTKKEISLIDITRKNEILFVDLPTEGKSVQSGKVGKLLLQEIMLISGLRKNYPTLRSRVPFSVYVDEFDAFATDSFATFQNKARSSNFMITVAHQTLSDLDKISPEFKNQILGNTNIRFVFRQDIPEDAETWSSFFGTKLAIKQTYRTTDGKTTGESSNRETKEFRIHPDTIKELDVGECVFSVKSSRTLMQARIPMRGLQIDPRPVERGPHDLAPLPFTQKSEITET